MSENSSLKTLFTGAASGIGRALTTLLASKGHALVLVDLAPLEKVCAESENVARLQGDATDESFWNDHAPSLQGLTHASINAGVAGSGLIDELDYAEWRGYFR